MNNSLIFNLGYDINKNMVQIDISKCPHILIGGTTGSGKTILLKSIFCQVKTPIILIDRKGTDYNILTGAKKLVFNKVLENDSDIFGSLLFLKQEIEKRKNTFQNCHVTNIKDYNNIYNDMTPILVIYDEFGNNDKGRKINNNEKDLLIDIIRKSRAFGIHFIIATQNPKASIIDTSIKANLPCRIALKTATKNETHIIMDDIKGCPSHELPTGQGLLYYKNTLENKLIFARSSYVSDSDIIQWIQQGKL